MGERKPPGPSATGGSLWPLRNAWNRETENLYSAWIAKLFDGPLDQELSWKTWDGVLHDQSRNFLFDYLGLSEDNIIKGLRPDCADFVYFLRAYFAFKMGLPFGYSNCSRGDRRLAAEMLPMVRRRASGCSSSGAGARTFAEPAAAAPPPPPAPAPNVLQQIFSPSPPAPAAPPPAPPAKRTAKPAAPNRQLGLASAFRQYLPAVADVVQTGAVRVLANDDRTDFYMVPLTQATLRPGTVYADPYGHVLMLVKLVPEANGSPGVFLAVDAEPDGSVTRKRFWRGNFLFVHDPTLGSPGFKRFRPIVQEKNGGLRRLTNAEIAKDPQYGDFSLDQTQLGLDQFYDRMDDVMSPEPVDPVRDDGERDRQSGRAGQDARHRGRERAKISGQGTR